MKYGRSLSELATELTRQANAKHDLLLPANELGVATFIGQNGPESLLVADNEYKINGVAHGQIAEYLGIPHGYYERLRSSAADLRVPVVDAETLTQCQAVARREAELASAITAPIDTAGIDADTGRSLSNALYDVTVNCLLESRGPEKRLVRTLDGKMRALLSDQFTLDFDNYEVYAMAARAIEESGLGPENVVSCEVTERKLYLKVLCPRLRAEIKPQNLANAHGMLKEPQVVQGGFVLSNSEVGHGAITVELMLYKLICKNGFVIQQSYRRRHVGKALAAGEDGVVYRSDTRQADAKARRLKLRDSIVSTLDEMNFQMLVARVSDSTGVRLDAGIEKTIEMTAQRFGLTQAERQSVFANLIEGADMSLWGLSNAITATAQEVPSYDRSTELEAIGGKLLTLPQGEVRELVAV